jgi:hypothetical protein
MFGAVGPTPTVVALRRRNSFHVHGTLLLGNEAWQAILMGPNNYAAGLNEF